MTRPLGALAWRGVVPVLVGVAAAACGRASEPEPAPDAPPVEGARLTVGLAPDAVTVEAAGAWVDDDGTGRGVDATATVPGAPPLVVSGATTTWDLKKGLVVLEGDVVATRAALELRCDRLEVRYDGDRVAGADASGHVRATQGDREVTAGHAALTTATGELVLDGAPRVVDGPNRLTGDRVTVWLDDDRLECERCRLEVDGAALGPPR